METKKFIEIVRDDIGISIPKVIVYINGKTGHCFVYTFNLPAI